MSRLTVGRTVCGGIAAALVTLFLVAGPSRADSKGFIGAGAILRREDIVSGVTTAAALWLATVLGLCFGGGQNALGSAALAFGIFILWALKRFEQWIPQERRAVLRMGYLCRSAGSVISQPAALDSLGEFHEALHVPQVRDGGRK